MRNIEHLQSTFEESKESKEEKERKIIDDYLGSDKLLSQISDLEYKKDYRRILENQFERVPPISENCKLTIILPAYREEDLIMEPLESLSKQEGIEADKFEVILVVNYPAGKKPFISDVYDKRGKLIRERHFDQTREMAEDFAKKHPHFHLRIVEQEFPEEVAGVGIASKLGMDLALMRQKATPGIISYYGADTTFDNHFARGLIDSFQDGTEAVRGRIKEFRYFNKVREKKDNGQEIETSLTQREIKEISDLSGRIHEYNSLMWKLRGLVEGSPDVEQRQTAGISNVKAVKYAEAGGMSDKKKGEDWDFADRIMKGGQTKLKHNEEVLISVWGRIDLSPRTADDSFTGTLGKAYRFLKHNENKADDGDFLVENPEYVKARVDVYKEFKIIFQGLKSGHWEKTNPRIQKDIVETIGQNKIEEMAEKSDGFENFFRGILNEFSEETKRHLGIIAEKRYPPLGLSKAIVMAKKMNERLEGQD